MAKIKQFPRKIFVKIDDDGDNSYFLADNNINSMLEKMGETVNIGIYELVETAVAKAVVETSKPVRKRP